MPPRFSVVVPLYNKCAHIGRALASVLAQRWVDFEVLVVNDGSTDGGERLVEACPDPRVRLVNQANQGASAARNRGARDARAAHVAFLDADDEWKPDFLAEIARLVDASPASYLFATAYQMTSPDGRQMSYSAERVGQALAGTRLDYLDCVGRDVYPFYTSTVCVNREAFLQAGGFDHSLAIGEDVDLWLRLSMQSAACFSQAVGAVYHRDAENRAMNQTGRALKILAFARRLSTLRPGLAPKQAHDLDSLISWNISRCCMSLMRSGDIAQARAVMGEFGGTLIPPVARNLSRKALKYTLLAPLYRLLQAGRQL